MIWRTKRDLPGICRELVSASEKQEWAAVARLSGLAVNRARAADGIECSAAVEVLGEALGRVRLASGRDLAMLAGQLIEVGASPGDALGALSVRIAEGLELATRFPALWGEAELPDPNEEDQAGQVMERLVDDQPVVEAWFTVGEWVQGLLLPMQRKDVRLALPFRERLGAALAATPEQIDRAYWLHGLLQVVDDEPLLVLDRLGERGYEVTISGIGDNFQLHTLLAAALIGDPAAGLIPGERPAPTWIAAATTGEMQPAGGISGQFNLVDATGEWIWNEGRPADIPFAEGRRVVVLDPPPYPRSWNAGRAYPLMEPALTVDRILSPDEAAHHLARVAPDQRAR
ncbi:hypothetical protein [Planotetraspora kaengkrachanensis]|uniref:Uncharacterized protein n=1 Tax=Planotetraspora kaengkrachanensis TaxID=575193 RepID=A0A8J3PZK3_9ACTN|nr:hypothetical protein [Planotetraspora kaengkrachanensis]GIG84079.1 hypothetical protein Pka01_72060 [Planotetraspora kaengkrachanensis]